MILHKQSAFDVESFVNVVIPPFVAAFAALLILAISSDRVDNKSFLKLSVAKRLAVEWIFR